MTTTCNTAGQVVSAVVPCSGFPPPRVERVPIVVCVEPDGFLRVFGSEGVDVRFIGPLDTLPENRTDAEDYASLRLPAPHRQIAFDARYIRGVFMPSPRTAEDKLERVITLSLVRECRR